MNITILSNGLPTPDHEPDFFDLPYTAIGDFNAKPEISLAAVPEISSTPVPEVSKLDFNSFGSHDELVSAVVGSMQRSGGCVIQNMISNDILAGLKSEIQPHLDQVKQADSSRESFVPSNTRMVTSLLSKSKTYALNVVGNTVFQSVSEYFLTSTLKNSWHGDQCHTSVSKPQLSTTIAFSVPPGTPAQGLHRDDDIYHTWHSAALNHHLGRDTMVCCFVAGSSCRARNGATRIIPGSHLWDFSRPPPTEDEEEKFFRAEMQPGDVFMMLGGVYHGAGANTTTEEERLMYAAFATRGFLRQEENQYLANDLRRIRELPLSIQEFAGFGVSKPYMGWVDLEDPIVSVLGGEKKADEKGFW